MSTRELLSPRSCITRPSRLFLTSIDFTFAAWKQTTIRTFRSWSGFLHGMLVDVYFPISAIGRIQVYAKNVSTNGARLRTADDSRWLPSLVLFRFGINISSGWMFSICTLLRALSIVPCKFAFRFRANIAFCKLPSSWWRHQTRLRVLVLTSSKLWNMRTWRFIDFHASHTAFITNLDFRNIYIE